MPLVLSAKEKASFDGPHKIRSVTGPITLFRLCGRSAAGETSNPYGRFWFNEKFFWRTLDLVSDSASNTAQLNHYMRLILREFTAVCHDWNSFASIYQLHLPATKTLEVAVGRIAPQPFYSSSDPRHRQSLPYEMLVGGDFQYIIDLQAKIELKRLVTGPRPLLLHRGGRG
jgi:hypothetical protein